MQVNADKQPLAGVRLNGDVTALAVDRAVGELRRGRAVCIESPEACLVFAAVETVGNALAQRLFNASDNTSLLLTRERARAAKLAVTEGPVAIAVDASETTEGLRALSGMSPEPDVPAAALAKPWTGDPALLSAGFGLTKAARLVPALFGYQAASLDDPSLLRVSLSAVLEYAASNTDGLQLISEARVPLADAVNSRVALFRDEYGSSEHIAIIVGEPDLTAGVPVRLHSACLTGDLLGSLRCDCGEQLRTAVARIGELGGGVLLYLDQEGRSIGLANKLRAYQIQDTGVDTFDADHRLGFMSDERSYDIAAAMLQRIGVSRVRLLTNNPEKIDALKQHRIEVEERIPLVTRPNEYNEAYLRSKHERAGHLGD